MYNDINKITNRMYTKFCNAQTLIRHIKSEQKDDQATHILLSVFKKSLSWLETKYDREMLLDSISMIQVRSEHLQEELVWIYVIEGGFWYHEMPFTLSEFARFTNYQTSHIRFQPNSTYAVLTEQAMRQLKIQNDKREKEKIVKFIKSNIFYPYYIQQQLMKEFAMVLRIKHLPYNKTFNWKDDDGSLKLAVIYRGVISIEYQWKRTVQIAEITKGMFLTNHYIKDDIEQLEDYSLDPVQDIKKMEFPKFKFISKTDETVLLVFNERLINETPYNVNPELKMNIKKQFEKYTNKLQGIIGFEEFNRLHRNKKSIKEELKKRKQKQTIKMEVTMEIFDKQKKLSPILQTYSNIHLLQNSFQTINNDANFPQAPKPFSHTVFSTISHSPRRLLRSKTTPINNDHNKSALIHNTWVEEMSKKKKNIKSFSTLKNLSTFHTEKHKHHVTVQQELGQQKQPTFFVPNQFVKRKLKLKYEDLISKMKNFDLKLTNKTEQSLIQKMKRLEGYIDSKRIVKLNTVRTKHKLLRDKVQY